MEIYVCSVAFDEKIDISLLTKRLVGLERLYPLFRRKEQEIREVLEAFGVKVYEETFFHHEKSEILIDEQKKLLVSVNVNIAAERGEFIEILVLYQDKEALRKIIETVRGTEKVRRVFDGTLTEALKVSKYEKELSNLSPHGRLLQEERIVTMCRKLYDSKIRNSIKKILSTFKGEPFPSRIVNSELAENEEERRIFERILNDAAFVRKMYVLTCTKCNYQLSALPFDSEESAIDALKRSAFVCPNYNCGSREVSASEVFMLDESVTRVVGSGIWLECMIGETIKKRAQKTWVGVMHDNDELDVVSVVFGGSVLSECKDASFGQTDLYSLLIQAESIGANTVLVITTNPIHHNVKTYIEKYNGQKGSRQIRTIEGDSEKIVQQLNGILDHMGEEYVNEIEKRLIVNPVSGEEFDTIERVSRMFGRTLP